MIETIQLLPGVTLRCFPIGRFKQNHLSIRFVRPLCREEAALNALLPAVLLRGSKTAPDMQTINFRLDDLYGASLSALSRQVGDYQTTGLGCSFIRDSFALEGDRVLEPVVDFMRELLLEPALQKGVFRTDYVESEKKNLISAIEAQRNDKRAYCANKMLEIMCKNDPFGVSRLGEKETVSPITAQGLYAHYQTLLAQSRIDIFYVGPESAQTLAAYLEPVFSTLKRDYVNLPAQTAFTPEGGGDHTETMDIAQGKLCMGFATPITQRGGDLAAMQVCNMVLGGGMTSKLFMVVREKLSLCYNISSGYYGSKGIFTVSAGIDCDKKQTVIDQVHTQLQAVCRGEITDQELFAAKEALLSSLRGTHDAPGSIESYYASAALSGMRMTPTEYMQKIQSVDVDRVAAAARSLQLDTTYFLQGVQ